MTPVTIDFAIDRGGTFTDVYGETSDGRAFVCKLLSEDPGHYRDAPSEGIRRVLEQALGAPVAPGAIPARHIGRIRMGTTVATNALLERKGEPTVLCITKGFGDLPRIGYQNRPDIFDLAIRRPSTLHTAVIEVDERIRPAARHDPPDALVTGVSGEQYTIVRPLDVERVRRDLARVRAQGIDSVAIVLLHAHACPEHERVIGRIARELGFAQISLSSEVMPMTKVVCRGDTTVVDAYLTPCIRRYINGFLRDFRGAVTDGALLFMQSDGGLTPARSFRGAGAILSGPAGGVVGYAVTTSRHAPGKPVIGFDMGGTSTDVSRYGGEYEIVHETETAGVRIQAPQLNINTVAAGGGSRLFFKNGMFVVGPESAGAHPGPVCYRKNGHLAVTDANLLLGRIQPQFFPCIFGENEDQPLDREAAARAFATLTDSINAHPDYGGRPLRPEQAAAGFIEVANQTMARAIREISVMRGYDLKDHILAVFGGAGGQHACAIARILGIKEIFIHRHSGILSAYGMGLADMVVERQRPAALTLAPNVMDGALRTLADLRAEAEEELRRQGIPDGHIGCRLFFHMRFAGSDTGFMVDITGVSKADTAEQRFRAVHEREFGFDIPGRAIDITDLRVRAHGRGPAREDAGGGASRRKRLPAEQGRVRCYFDGRWRQTPVFHLEALPFGFTTGGPALIINDTATIVVDPGCRARVTTDGSIAIAVGADEARRRSPDTRKDPVRLAVFANLFMSIAEQMGRTLQRTAVSTNIKERLDYSCALFDASGRLIANAPHIPVHLGAMSFAVREQIRLRGRTLRPGDVLLSNHPAAGGSHLPDITVITPVWRDGRVIFFTASRGHHADIGGTTPGSMPPFSRTLADEGAAIASFRIVKEGRFDEKGIRALLAGSRRIEDNISDIKAQIAANQRGIALLSELVRRHGMACVTAYMGHIHDSAAEAVRDMIRRYCRRAGISGRQRRAAEEFMDDGSRLAVSVEFDSESGGAVFDFTGTSPQTNGNWNAPEAVVASAVMFCLRAMSGADLPLNQGFLAPIDIVIPPGSLLSPDEQAAVVGGNVLTSQRLTDLIFKALEVMAASQGCMNNLTFGNDTFGYYETIGGGAGAGPGWHGQSGVHTNMTNTRITDPEILEQRYPVMLRQFGIRRGSGGAGRFRGGDGLVREFEALEPLHAALLTERRKTAPFGMAGGEDGLPGRNLLIRADGEEVELDGKCRLSLRPGDRLRILTPGGGGWGGEANKG